MEVEIIEGVKHYRTFSGNTKEISSEKKTGFLRQILKALRFFTFARKVYLISKKEQVDVLHAHAMFFCAFAAKLSSLLLAKPMVYEVRSLWEERYKDVNLSSKIIFNTITLIETLAMYLSDEIIAINN